MFASILFLFLSLSLFLFLEKNRQQILVNGPLTEFFFGASSFSSWLLFDGTVLGFTEFFLFNFINCMGNGSSLVVCRVFFFEILTDFIRFFH